MQYTQHNIGSSSVLLNQAALIDYSGHLFDQQPADAGQLSSNTEGRGTVVFFEHAGLSLVRKQYHRGGLLGRLIKNTYLFTGTERSRMWQEFLLLGQMRDLELPVPRPIAARCIRTGWLNYQGELITERIPEAHTLADTLCKRSLPDQAWEAIGGVVRCFHAHRIDHTDLNAANILLTADSRIYLIDFDKCAIRSRANTRWPQRNLQRLKRSLHKWQSRSSTFHFEESHWQALCRGYEQLNCSTPSSNAPRLNNFRSLP
jgi:3-deoxy-D-manno-octulosonic acid kinase